MCKCVSVDNMWLYIGTFVLGEVCMQTQENNVICHSSYTIHILEGIIGNLCSATQQVDK